MAAGVVANLLVMPCSAVVCPCRGRIAAAL
jgi:hypothetical protein